MPLRQTTIIITWTDDERPELIDGDEWGYTLRMGGVDVEHVVVGEDLPLPRDCPLSEAIASSLAWAARQ